MITDDYTALLLELVEFLAQRPQDAVQLTSRERHMLKRGDEFLQRVLTGHGILTRGGALIPDLSSLNAYSFASRALPCSSSHLGEGDGNTRRILFEKAVELLRQIEAGVALADLPSTMIKEVHQLFACLAQFAFSHTNENFFETRTEWLTILDLTQFT
jgi:hypothetical protein